MNKIVGVYEIVNTVNEHRYVGSSVSMPHRWICHKSDLINKHHHSVYLQRAYDKYGADCFKFSVLEYCEKEQLINREQFYIDTLFPAYNILPTAYSCLGTIRSDETKKRISISKSGDNCSKETRIKLSIAHKGIPSGNKGHKYSDESRAKISVSHKGRKASEETKAKMRVSSHRGEENNKSKLTFGQVEEIRNRYIPRKVSQRQLAKEYNVNQQVIWSILNLKTWRTV